MGNRWTNNDPSQSGSDWRRGQRSLQTEGGVRFSSITEAKSTSKYSPLRSGLEEQNSSGLAKFALSGPISPDIRMSSSSGSEGTSWQRGLKVGDVSMAANIPKKNDSSTESFVKSANNEVVVHASDDLDMNMNLSGLSIAALQFEQEKQKMRDLFSGGEGDGLKGGGLGSGLDANGEGFRDRDTILNKISETSDNFQHDHELVSRHGQEIVDIRPEVELDSDELHRDVSGSSNAAVQSALTSNNEWYYKDPAGNVQGPFTGARMRQWHSQGCFDSVPDLPLRQGESGGFYPLSKLHLLDLGGGWN